MDKLILTLVGQMASGKDTVADYLKEKYNASKYSFSDMLSDTLKRFNLEINRDNLIKISEMIRETFGENTMAKTMAKDAGNDQNKIIIIPNARRLADITYLSKLPGFVLVKIDAEPKIRYERLTDRREKIDDKTKTFAEFLEDHKRSTELSISEVAKQATEKIDNNGNFEDLYKQLDNLVKKYAN